MLLLLLILRDSAAAAAATAAAAAAAASNSMVVSHMSAESQPLPAALLRLLAHLAPSWTALVIAALEA
eukprot:2776-Heterococcus_DN1.PRE.2